MRTKDNTVTNEQTDSYLALAKEVRDQIKSLVTDIENDEGLACLVNCADPDDETFWVYLKSVIPSVVQAYQDMKALVEWLERTGREQEK